MGGQAPADKHRGVNDSPLDDPLQIDIDGTVPVIGRNREVGRFNNRQPNLQKLCQYSRISGTGFFSGNGRGSGFRGMSSSRFAV